MADLGLDALRLGLFLCALGIGAGMYAGVSKRADWTRVAERTVLSGLRRRFGGDAGALLGARDERLLALLRRGALRAHDAPALPTLGTLGWAGGLAAALGLDADGSTAPSPCWATARRTDPHALGVRRAARECRVLPVAHELRDDPLRARPHEPRLSDGNGLNPLLQHPVMMIHPVMLYTGFTGFALPFAFAFAAIVTGELGTTWFRTTRRWTLFAWSVLSAGIMLGGRWAYEVLGWGGYWAWDPVENASLMPWIAGTAYIHSVMIQEKRDMLKTWNLVLIGLTYGALPLRHLPDPQWRRAVRSRLHQLGQLRPHFPPTWSSSLARLLGA